MSSSEPIVVQTLANLDSVMDNLLLLLSDKEKQVVLRRFGINSAPKSTLEAIGKDFGVTRERVRQIERTALAKMRRNVFNSSLKDLHQYVSTLLADFGGLVSEDEVVHHMLSLREDGYNVESLRLAVKLNDQVDCVGNTINFKPYIKRVELSDFTLKHVAKNLINELQKAGDVRSFEEVESRLNAVMQEANFSSKSLRSLVQIDKRLLLLDDELLGLSEWRHVRPRTLRDKILFVLRRDNRPLHFSYIAGEIDSLNFDNKRVNLQAVHNELIRHEQFVLVGRGIYALQDWGYERGTVAEVIEDILNGKTEMHQDDIVTAVLKKRQVKEVTVILALKNGERFKRVGRKLYALR